MGKVEPVPAVSSVCVWFFYAFILVVNEDKHGGGYRKYEDGTNGSRNYFLGRDGGKCFGNWIVPDVVSDLQKVNGRMDYNTHHNKN